VFFIAGKEGKKKDMPRQFMVQKVKEPRLLAAGSLGECTVKEEKKCFKTWLTFSTAPTAWQ